jgi:hypothetical protein
MEFNEVYYFSFKTVSFPYLNIIELNDFTEEEGSELTIVLIDG